MFYQRAQKSRKENMVTETVRHDGMSLNVAYSQLSTLPVLF